MGYLFLLPWIIGFLFLQFTPFVTSFVLSFSKWNIVGAMEWSGFDNFRRMFDSESLYGTEFRKSLVVTFTYALGSIPLKVIWAIAIALLLRRPIRGQRFFTVVFYLPSVISGISMALMWKWVFNAKSGLANGLLGLLGIEPLNWFLRTYTAVPAFIAMSLWDVGLMMVIYLGALKAIPREIEESAAIDGARAFPRLFRITLPMISPVILYQVVMGIISSFQVFDYAYVISGGGGPGSPNLGGPSDAYLFYVLNIYKHAFVNLKMGYASALAWVLFLLILVLTLGVLKASPLWVYYRGDDR